MIRRIVSSTLTLHSLSADPLRAFQTDKNSLTLFLTLSGKGLGREERSPLLTGHSLHSMKSDSGTVFPVLLDPPGLGPETVVTKRLI